MTGREISRRKVVCILSYSKIHDGNSPGAARLRNIAKAFAHAGDEVYLFSSLSARGLSKVAPIQIHEKIFAIGESSEQAAGIGLRGLRAITNSPIQFYFVYQAVKRMRAMDADVSYYLYPSFKVSLNFASILIIRWLYNGPLFCDVNEVMKVVVENVALSSNVFVRVTQYLRHSAWSMKFALDEQLYRCYSGLVAISRNIEAYFLTYNTNIILVPILADTQGVEMPEPRKIQREGVFRMAFAGAISLKKEGFDLLYEALSIVTRERPKWELHLFGPVLPFQKEPVLETLPKQFGISDKIIYHGNLTPEALAVELKQFDLLLIPRPLSAQTFYGFSTKLGEYLISGVPVLVTDVSDNAAYIKDGVNGFIVPPGDVSAMATKMLYIIEHYVELNESVAREAFKTARRSFDHVNFGKMLHDFLFPAV